MPVDTKSLVSPFYTLYPGRHLGVMRSGAELIFPVDRCRGHTVRLPPLRQVIREERRPRQARPDDAWYWTEQRAGYKYGDQA